MSRRLQRRSLLKRLGAMASIGLAGNQAGGDGGGRTINMGLLMGVTGGLKSLGPPIRQAAELAATQVNEADTDFQVDVQFEDTATSPSQGVSGAEALVNAGYPMICGALSSEVTLQVANNVTIPNGIVQCSPASTSPRLTTLQDNDYVYRTTPTDKLQGEVLAQIAAERLDHDSASTLYLNNAYGSGLSEGFVTAFGDQYDGEVTNQVSFSKAQSSYTSQLQQALQGDPGTMLVVGYPESGVQIFRDFYSEFGRDDMDVLVSDGFQDSSLPGRVGFDMTNVRGTAPAPAGPGRDFFEQQFQQAYDATLGPFTWQGYDAAAVLVLANAAAGENTGSAVRDQLRDVANPDGEEVTPQNLADGIEQAAQGTTVNYQGVAGPITFDDNGDLRAAVYDYYRFTQDGLETIETITYGE